MVERLSGAGYEDEDDDDEDEAIEPQPEVAEVAKPKPEVKTDSKPDEKTPAEKEKDRHQQITELVGGLQTGEWQKAQESERLDKRYGKGLLGNFRAWLGGEFDYSVDPETGEIRHNVGNEVGRRVVNVLWKTAKTAAIISAVGLLTGGAGAVPAGAILGSSLGRGFCEAWKGFSGKEGSLREKLILARESYYDEAEKLSKEIGPENPEGITGQELVDYKKDRNEKINSLVRLVYTVEKDTVEKEKKEKEKTEEKKAPSTGLTAVAKAEGELSGYQKKWRTAEEIIAFVGGITGGVYSLLHAKGQVVQHLQSRLDHGESLRMDIDHDGVFHSVSRIDSGIKTAHDMSSNYVFKYNSPFEAKLAELQGGTILHQGQFGAHVISDNISSGLSRIATGQLWHQSISTLLGMAADSAVSSKINQSEEKLGDSYQKSFPESSGKTLEFLLPESKLDKIKVKAKELGKTMPQPGEIWDYPPQAKGGKKRGGQSGENEPKERKVKIISINYIDEEVPTLIFESGKPGSEKQGVALETFIAANSKLLPGEKVAVATDGTAEKSATTPSLAQQAELVSQLERTENLPKEKIEMFRNAAMWVLSRATKEDRSKLNPKNPAENNPAERDKRFKALAREVLANEFVVHFTNKGFDNDDGKRYPDLDGRCMLGLLALAGIENKSAPTPVAAGEFIPGKINVWTGVFAGGIDSAEKWQYSDDTTGFADMHGQSVDQKQSATKTIHEVMVGLGLLENQPYIQKIVDFATACDNLTYPNTLEDYKKSDRTLYGLSRYMKFENVEKFFQNGRDPSEQLSDEDLVKYGLVYTNRKKEPVNRSAQRKEFIEKSLKNIERLEKEGWVLESKNFGKILVNVPSGSGDESKMNAESAYAAGFKAYLIWNPSGKSLFLSCRHAFPDDFSLDEGVATRENMWIRNSADGALKMNLQQVLERIAGSDFGVGGQLAEYLRNESAASLPAAA